MPEFKITWSTPYGKESQIIEAADLETAEQAANEAAFEAWSDKIYALAEPVDEAGKDEGQE